MCYYVGCFSTLDYRITMVDRHNTKPKRKAKFIIRVEINDQSVWGGSFSSAPPHMRLLDVCYVSPSEWVLRMGLLHCSTVSQHDHQPAFFHRPCRQPSSKCCTRYFTGIFMCRIFFYKNDIKIFFCNSKIIFQLVYLVIVMLISITLSNYYTSSFFQN